MIAHQYELCLLHCVFNLCVVHIFCKKPDRKFEIIF